MHKVVLEDVVDKIIDYRGKTPKKLGADWKKTGIPAISAKNIKNGTIVRPDSIRYVDQVTYEKWMKEKIRQGDVLMTSEAPLGETYYVNSDTPFVLSQRLFAMRTNPDILNAKYFYILTKTKKFQNLLQTFGTGSTVSGIRQQLLRKLPLEIADIETQKKIADIIWDYDALIENNHKRIEKLETMARLLYRHYFESLDAVDWPKLPLSEALIVHRGKSYKSSELSEKDGLPFINLKCVNRGGGFRKDGLKLFNGKFKDTQRVERGDLVMAVTDMTQERMIIARAARVPNLQGGHGVISMDMVKIEPKAGFSKDYLYAMFRWSGFANEVKNHANGANVLHLIPARITDYSLPMPPRDVQQNFAEKVLPLFNLVDNLQQKNENLSKARDLLLPRLMSGDVEL
jgi:type I restriction enzyme S subunit